MKPLNTFIVMSCAIFIQSILLKLCHLAHYIMQTECLIRAIMLIKRHFFLWYRVDHCILAENQSADNIHWSNAGLLLVQRHRRCTSINPALVQRLVSAREAALISTSHLTHSIMSRTSLWDRRHSRVDPCHKHVAQPEKRGSYCAWNVTWHSRWYIKTE